uniref:LamG-like jellyroll fold domain-containing protein n=1 Tax=viral metagenome TaxID=1070528 RepID=A0A6C0IIY4_9ZZZZ
MSDTFNTFSTNTGNNSSFSESNSLVAKFSFLLLVIFMFILLLNIGISLISWFVKPSASPKLINGMIDATQMVTFTQDPSLNGSATIYRSNNATDGIEFTWSVWIFINNLQYLEGQYKHIFYKGNNNLDTNGLNFPNNAPGLYIAPNTNALVVMMNTFNDINEETIIPDIPLNKWVNVIIRCKNNKLDVYVNGTITRSVQLMGVPKQNYGDVFVAANGGFNGYISNLWYYDYALGTSEIANISTKGPNTKLTSTSSVNNSVLKDPNYLSLRWYFYGSGDSYNPV